MKIQDYIVRDKGNPKAENAKSLNISNSTMCRDTGFSVPKDWRQLSLSGDSIGSNRFEHKLQVLGKGFLYSYLTSRARTLTRNRLRSMKAEHL